MSFPDTANQALLELAGMNVTVMGLGLHGGGIETTRFLVEAGAVVTVTDLRDERTLSPSLDKLAGLKFRTVLGRHEEADFSDADMVVKNPAVRPGNKYLALSKRVETDLSLFFSIVPNRVIAVTGSKGKSTTASAIHYILSQKDPGTRLGGNITISPLSFFRDLAPRSYVVMELSSFQLGDLERSSTMRHRGRLRGFPPFIAIMTSIFRDHQDYYGSMDSYISDKEVIFRHQGPGEHAIFMVDDEYGKAFASRAQSRVWRVSRKKTADSMTGWLDSSALVTDNPFLGPQGYFRDEKGNEALLVPERLNIVGGHHRANLLQAGMAATIAGFPVDQIPAALAEFGGVPHRLETIDTYQGITFVNDSAATIPEATLSAMESLGNDIFLITGGTDKALDFSLFGKIGRKARHVALLAGTASDRIARIFDEQGIRYWGPYDDISVCVSDMVQAARHGGVVLLSPGCASFGLFLNEFDRGNRFKAAVREYLSIAH